MGALALVSIGVLARPKAVDPLTGCPVDQVVPAAHTVVVIDQTDRFNPAQVTYAKKLILYEYNRLHRYEMLTVRGVGNDPDAPARKFQLCRVQKRAEVLGLAVNEDQVADRFEKVAGVPMAHYLDSLATVGEAAASPLVETFSAISRDEDFGPAVAVRRLVVVSDMAQNSPNFTQYGRGGAAVSLPADLGVFTADLKGAAVRIHYLLRPALRHIQGEAHQRAWKSYFKSAGAADVEIGWGLGLGDPKS